MRAVRCFPFIPRRKWAADSAGTAVLGQSGQSGQGCDLAIAASRRTRSLVDEAREVR